MSEPEPRRRRWFDSHHLHPEFYTPKMNDDSSVPPDWEEVTQLTECWFWLIKRHMHGRVWRRNDHEMPTLWRIETFNILRWCHSRVWISRPSKPMRFKMALFCTSDLSWLYWAFRFTWSCLDWQFMSESWMSSCDPVEFYLRTAAVSGRTVLCSLQDSWTSFQYKSNVS